MNKSEKEEEYEKEETERVFRRACQVNVATRPQYILEPMNQFRAASPFYAGERRVTFSHRSRSMREHTFRCAAYFCTKPFCLAQVHMLKCVREMSLSVAAVAFHNQNDTCWTFGISIMCLQVMLLICMH